LFLDATGSLVKLGLVLHPSRVKQRLAQVSRHRRHPREGLRCVAQTPLHNVTHQAAEHIEAAARRWLCNAHAFSHAGFVDWLEVPGTPPGDWQALLDDAVVAALSFGKQ
jgi:hypothetical protein